MRLVLDSLKTPIGTLALVSDGEALLVLHFDTDEAGIHRVLTRYHGGEVMLAAGRCPVTIKRALQSYFEGDLEAIDAIPVRTGGSDFQKSVWMALRKIPVGSTTSYGRLAEKLGKPNASRAVGLANGSNPVGVVLPCHRVIGSDGSLTGYGGGLPRKHWLLTHEGVKLRKDNQLALDFV
jgi:methylated-DNA-[protein]-cysteine S-methyltransferase